MILVGFRRKNGDSETQEFLDQEVRLRGPLVHNGALLSLLTSFTSAWLMDKENFMTVNYVKG